jgi:hypothetical protein
MGHYDDSTNDEPFMENALYIWHYYDIQNARDDVDTITDIIGEHCESIRIWHAMPGYEIHIGFSE